MPKTNSTVDRRTAFDSRYRRFANVCVLQYPRSRRSDFYSHPSFWLAEKTLKLRFLVLDVYTLSDLKAFGKEKGWCPYFLARHVISYANVIVCNYQYLIDPKVAEMVAPQLESNCVVVFDEAHNIDDIAIEALSVFIDRETLFAARNNIRSLRKVSSLKKNFLKMIENRK